MIALIDGDIVVYRVGYTTEADSEGIARARTNEMIETILEETKANQFECWLSDSAENNFRYKIFPAYKGNRTQPRPKHYDLIKEHLLTEWSARFAHGMEADDALGFRQDQGPIEYGGQDEFGTVICSIDKDLLQVPGLHYNFVKKEWIEVTSWEGLKWFYKQILIGDVSDNIKGCKGIGPVKAGKILDPVSSSEGEQELLKRVFACYQRQEKARSQEENEEIVKHIILTGSLLKIKQEEGEPSWDSLSYKLMEGLRSSFTQPVVVESTPSTEPTTAMTKTSDGSLFSGSLTDTSSGMEKQASST